MDPSKKCSVDKCLWWAAHPYTDVFRIHVKNNHIISMVTFFGLNVFQTVFNNDFDSLIFFEFKPAFGNFRNAWIQLNNFYGKLNNDRKELFSSNKATISQV